MEKYGNEFEFLHLRNEHYMTTMDYVSVCDVASNTHYDQIYILVNTDKYGRRGHV